MCIYIWAQQFCYLELYAKYLQIGKYMRICNCLLFGIVEKYT